MFVWIGRLYRGALLSIRNAYIPSQTDSSLCIPPCTSIGMFCVRLTPAVCRIAPNRTACDILRFYSAGSRSPFVRSRSVGAVICLGWFTSGLAVSLWRSRRVTGVRGTGMAARPLCVFAQAHWLCCSFLGEYVGAPRPKPAPKSLRLSGLSSFDSRQSTSYQTSQ